MILLLLHNVRQMLRAPRQSGHFCLTRPYQTCYLVVGCSELAPWQHGKPPHEEDTHFLTRQMSRLASVVVVVLLLAGLGWPVRSALVAYYSFDDRTLIA